MKWEEGYVPGWSAVVLYDLFMWTILIKMVQSPDILYNHNTAQL